MSKPLVKRSSANAHDCTNSNHYRHPADAPCGRCTSRRSATARRAVAKTTTPMPHPSGVSADDQPLHQQQQPSSTTPTPPPRRAPADDYHCSQRELAERRTNRESVRRPIRCSVAGRPVTQPSRPRQHQSEPACGTTARAWALDEAEVAGAHYAHPARQLPPRSC